MVSEISFSDRRTSTSCPETPHFEFFYLLTYHFPSFHGERSGARPLGPVPATVWPAAVNCTECARNELKKSSTQEGLLVFDLRFGIGQSLVFRLQKARPHPGLLPQEKENDPPIVGKTGRCAKLNNGGANQSEPPYVGCYAKKVRCPSMVGRVGWSIQIEQLGRELIRASLRRLLRYKI